MTKEAKREKKARSSKGKQRPLSPPSHASVVQAIEDFNDRDLEAGDNIPTIELSTEAEVPGFDISESVKKSGSGRRNNRDNTSGTVHPIQRAHRKFPLTSAIAVPVSSLMSRGGVAPRENPKDNKNTRAEFVSAIFIKPSVESELGLSFKTAQIGCCVVISRIRPNGLISKSGAPFKEGDRVLSINGLSCEKLDHKSAAKLLRDVNGKICIIAHNEGGDSQLVETMVTKPAPNHQAGIGFSSPESIFSQINVSRILADGLFAESLVTVGDEVISINGIPCRELDPSAVADIISSAPKYVNVVAKKFQGNGTVIASGSGRNRFSLGESKQRRFCAIACQVLFCCTFLTALVVLILYLQLK